MQKQKLVLVGNGMAGVHCIEQIIKNNPEQFEITIFGKEPYGNYNRILLSSVLQGNAEIDEIMLHHTNWYKDQGITLYTGETVGGIDSRNQYVQTDQGREVYFDKLILATGSNPFILPIQGRDKEGVWAFRTIGDCEGILADTRQSKKAAVIGGGLLGLEAAKGLLNHGIEVTVVHNTRYLMERQLDVTAAKMLKTELESQGMKFMMEKDTKEIFGENRAEGIRFSDGSKLDADLVIMAVGVRPNIQIAKDSGVKTNRGIVVNDVMQTNIPAIYAVGECAEHEGMVYGIVKPLYEQAKVLAKHICGILTEGYRGSVLSTQLKISGVDVFSIGQLEAGEKAVTIYNTVDGVYKKMIFHENKLIGAVLYGDTSESGRLLELITKKKDVDELEKGLLLASSVQEEFTVALIKPSDVICNCNGVTKGTIIDCVRTQNLTSVEQVKECTKASSSCGGCQPLIANLLAYTQSEDFDEPLSSAVALCSCTSLTEDEIVEQIQLLQVNTFDRVAETLGWRNREGCQVCQPAIHYYLGMIDPLFETKKEMKLGGRLRTFIEEQACGCGSQESLKLANAFEKTTEVLNTPHRMKIGISPCQHCDALSIALDIGLIHSEGRWEMYVGGRSGKKIRAGSMFYVADSYEEVFELTLGLVQYYRETANYLEQTWEWTERLGLIHLREVIFNQEIRSLLLERMETESGQRKNPFKKTYI